MRAEREDRRCKHRKAGLAAQWGFFFSLVTAVDYNDLTLREAIDAWQLPPNSNTHLLTTIIKVKGRNYQPFSA